MGDKTRRSRIGCSQRIAVSGTILSRKAQLTRSDNSDRVAAQPGSYTNWMRLNQYAGKNVIIDGHCVT